MNREIKFRAWHNANKVMMSHKEIPVLLKNVEDCNVWKYMQYTGLKDKKGTEIYEGDVIEYECGTTDYIVWNIDWQFHTKNNYSNNEEDLSQVIVIGNIYENPEFLI